MNPWKALGIHKQATEAEVRAAYMALSWKHHPDRGGRTDRFAELSAAYALLKNKKRLAVFLSELTALGKQCAPCRGQGATFKQKGLTGRTATACKSCGGMGIIVKEKRR